LEAARSTPVTLTDGTQLALSISLGVADLPQHANGLERLYETAGAAPYDAKRAGAECVAVRVAVEPAPSSGCCPIAAWVVR
jgi:predicted signal transduction protein with EAL and GGDEF domain